MTEKLKDKWLKLYFLAQQIGAFEPWDDFEEADHFSYVWKDKSKAIHFSFIGEWIGQCGIACYTSDENYMRARELMKNGCKAHEPVFDLQNALICLWDDREDISNADYKLIKELGFKFRGRGAWLHFNKYEIGYEATSLDEKDIDLLITAFENLNMMLRAIYEQGLDPEFDKGHTLLRWYEPKDELYYTHPFKIDIPRTVIKRPIVTMQDNEFMRVCKKAPFANFSVELDWSYLPFPMKEGKEKAYFPLSVMMADAKSGMIIANELLEPDDDKIALTFEIFEYFAEKRGKPNEIFICDEDIKGIISDVCKRCGIKLTMKKHLPKISEARNDLIKHILNTN